jgi:hypothetical protein
MPVGFIKDEELLREDCRVDDLLDITTSVDTYEAIVKNVTRPTIIGVVGGFGVGKSTMLHQVEKRLQDDFVWINFDAWKYPDRRCMWEGFVLDFADQMGELDQVRNKVDGKADVMVEGAGKIASIAAKFAPVPGLADLVECFKGLFSDAPATRVFELQAVFQGMIAKIKKPIVAVIEDIDRSGEEGRFFLETLKQFLQSLPTDRVFIALVPMADKNYRKEIDSYAKCLDMVEFYDPTSPGLERFVDAVFGEEPFSEDLHHWHDGEFMVSGKSMRGQVVSFLEMLLESDTITIRTLKLVLRNALDVFLRQCNDGHQPDFRVTIGFEASKFLKSREHTYTSDYDYIAVSRRINRPSLLACYLFRMTQDISTLTTLNADGTTKLLEPPTDVELLGRQGANGTCGYPSYPWVKSAQRFGEPGGEVQAYVADFYVKY